MRRLIIVLAAVFSAVSLQAQTPAQKYVDYLATVPPLKDAVWGVLAKDASGQVLVEHNSGALMIPASNMKLVTTGTALVSLGADYRMGTSIGYTGEIEGGVLNGDLYIIGGGDPTLCSPDSIATSMAATFLGWRSFMQKAGIRSVHGRVIGDGRLWDTPQENPDWTWEDIGLDYGSGGSALGFFSNMVEYEKGRSHIGEPVPLTQIFPETPWMRVTNRTRTERPGTGNHILYFTSDLVPVAEIRGTFAVDRWLGNEYFANKYGALTCAYYFWKDLADAGIEVTGGYADIDRDGLVRTGADFVSHEPAGEPVCIGTSYSPVLRRIAMSANCRSDNYYAEAMFHTMGHRLRGCAQFDSCAVAVRTILDDMGLPENGIRIIDGSGLSRRNYVTPEFMVEYLQQMSRSGAWAPFLQSLPYPGGNGTLRNVLRNYPNFLRRRIRMKSGSMDGVLCYSGYILPPAGVPGEPITFSIMTNNCTGEFADVRELITKILVLLAQ